MEGANKFDVMLYKSSRNGDLNGVMDALAQGGRVGIKTSEGFTPLIIAAKYGNTDICGLLLAYGSNVNEVVPVTKHTALHYAAANGHQAVVEALLSWGAAVDQQGHAGFTPLLVACQDGQLPCVLTLLEAGASFSLHNHEGNFPIHAAAQKNRVKIVKALLEHGCSQDMVSCSGVHFLDAQASLAPIHVSL